MAIFTAGQRLRASALEALSVRASPIGAYKQADTTRVSNVTATADPELTVSVPIGVYICEAVVLYQTPAAADFKVGWIGGTGANVGQWWSKWRTSDGTEVSGVLSSDVSLRNVVGASAMPPDQPVNMGGVCVVTQASSLAIRWAQVTSTAGDTKVLAGSYLRLVKIS